MLESIQNRPPQPSNKKISMKTPTDATKHDEKFALIPFFFWIGLTIAGYLSLLRLGFPAIWKQQLAGGLWPIIFVALAFHLFNAGFEFVFHRYVLHAKVFKWLIRFYRDHTKHHALTPAKPLGTNRVSKQPLGYPITDPRQYASSFFPYWGLAGFTLAFLPLTLFVQWLMPNSPILLGSFVAMTFSYCLYELLHALEHLPYESFWKRLGKFGDILYGFHLFHHAEIMANMAISGFFGLPLFDWIFGTYKQPKRPLINGNLSPDEDLSPPKPCLFIRWLDRILVEKSKAT